MTTIFLLNNINTVITVLTSLGTLFGVVIPILNKIFIYFAKTKYIKNVLLSRTKKVSVSFSIFYKTKAKNLGYEYDFVTLPMFQSHKRIIDLCNMVKKETLLFTENNYTEFDEIHIGGPLTNSKVNSLMVNHFIDCFKFLTSKTNMSRYEKYDIDTTFIEYTEAKSGFALGKTDPQIYTIDNKISDYAIFIRLINRESNKTVHIIFGGYDKGTSQAVCFFVEHIKEIYCLAKKNGRDKQNYFFVLPINKIDNSYNSSIGLMDLTDIMFKG